jgi:hypothetical protein
VLNNVSGARLQHEMRYPSSIDPSVSSPALTAPMEDLSDEFSLRILEILDRTLESLGDALREIDSSTAGVTLMLPIGRDDLTLDKEMIGDILWSYLPDLQPRSLEIVPENQPATAALGRLCMRLHGGEIDTALFCGVDSLIDAQCYDELASDGRLMSQLNPHGLIPGEGGGAILLRSVNRLGADDIPVAIIGNLGVAPEPNIGEAEEKPMTGLAKAARSATAQQSDCLAQMPSVFYAMPSEVSYSLEWHQAQRQIWPQRLEESQRVAMMLGEVDSPQIEDEALPEEHNLSYCLGETGTASLPLLITLACEKIRYDAHHQQWGFAADTQHLICELGDQPWRGALWLTPHSPPSTTH